MSLVLPSRFDSSTSPGRYLHYVVLKSAGAPITEKSHTIQYCYGAGGSCLDLNLYQDFVLAHPTLTLLCVDRWCQGIESGGKTMLEALSQITAELFLKLGINRISLVAHSAGIYQALDLATRYADLVNTVYPVCSHIPAHLTASKAMTFMTRAPNTLLQLIGRLDTMDYPGILRAWIGMNSIVKDNTVVAEARYRQLRAHQGNAEQELMRKRRRELDYALCYQHIRHYSGDALLALYINCPRPLVWLTTVKDKFFGPTAVLRVLDQRHKGYSNSSLVRFDDADHADIYLRQDVWESLYEMVCQNRVALTV